jgi:hypothetical protein
MKKKQIPAESQLTKQVKIKIANLVLEARCDEPSISLEVSGDKQNFLVKEGKPDCILNVHYQPLPDLKLEQQVYDSGDGPWRLFRSGEKLVFQMVGLINGQDYIHRVVIFEPDFSRGELYIRPASELPANATARAENPAGKRDPFMHPLDLFLVINLLPLKGGLNLHSVGVVYDGQGLIFCGVSGAGKSTTAMLWKERHSTILSDERVALRKHNGKIWAFGTPWKSSARTYCADKAPLKALYFIEHGTENRIIPLNPLEVTSKLLIRCFMPEYLQHAMELTLDFINVLAQEVPCFEFQFTPDQSAIDKVIEHVKTIKP